jgi:carbon monoxide dehydrogenase subunit G
MEIYNQTSGGGTPTSLPDSTPTNMGSGILYSDGTQIHSDTPATSLDGSGNLTASSVTATHYGDISGTVGVNPDISNAISSATGFYVASSGGSISGTVGVNSDISNAISSATAGTLTSVNSGCPSTLSGVVFGNGSSLSSDSSITTNGSGTLAALGLSVGAFGSDSSGNVSALSLNVNSSASIDSGGNLNCGGSVIVFSNLPTSDPANAGQLWNDSGTLKVSAG